MRKTYRLDDGTVIEPRDVAGRGHTVHNGGWIVTRPGGRSYETRETLSELRARLGRHSVVVWLPHVTR